MQWKEEFSRDIALVLMEQYSSVADALFELVDNPIDFRRGRKLSIQVSINKEQDSIVVEDHGGEGMNGHDIAQWLRWGSSSRQIRGTDISRWRVGGKAACGYLADRIVMYARRASTSDVWVFEDNAWSTRSQAADWGEPTPLPRDVPLPRSLKGYPKEEGFVRIELSSLRPRHYNVEDLRWHLSNTYRRLLDRRAISISINDEPVLPMELPRSSAFEERPIDLRTASGKRVAGWVARLDRDAIVGPSARRRIPGGIRCLYQGRLVAAGEYFGHSGDTKGSLASLIGEIELNFVRPNIMKTDFDRGSLEWHEVEQVMSDFLGPIIREFRLASDRPGPTREQRKALGKVCDELAEALRIFEADRSWDASPNDLDLSQRGDITLLEPRPGYGGTIPSRHAERRTSVNPVDADELHSDSDRKQNRLTRAPDNAVGKTIRLLDKIAGGGLRPPAILDAFDPSLRSGWRTQEGQTKVVVNTEYPLFKELGGADGYLAETVILELAKPIEGQQRTLDEYVSEVNALLLAWAKVHGR